MNAFKLITDGNEIFIADAAVGACSFAMVVSSAGYPLNRKDDAIKALASCNEQALSGSKPRTRMMETPSRFESIADILYGDRW